MTHILYNLQAHSFILMSNHYHLIASTPDSNLSTCMQYFSKSVSMRLTRKGNRFNQTFAGRYYKSILHQTNYYLNAYKYCYRNPVTARICNRVQDYPLSTLEAKLGGAQLLVPIIIDDTLFPDTNDCVDWLNRNPQAEQMDAVRCALKRKYFKLRNDPKSKKPHLCEGLRI